MDHLAGVRVVSFNHFLMGPLAMQFLGDLGADVIAVEPVDGAFQRKWGGADKQVDGQSMLLLTGNRNKRSCALNLKSEKGLEIARRLVERADVVAENYRPGVMQRFGLDYENLCKIKPDIIYAAASGFGQDGPYAKRPGQDLIVQAMSGLAMITGDKRGGPRAIGVSAVDHHGASLLAAGVLAALLRRERTGRGGRVDVDLLSAALDLQMESLTCYLNGDTPETVYQSDNLSGWYYGAPYGVYLTSDGYICISLGPLSNVYDALGTPDEERVPDGDYYSRRTEAAATIAEAVATRTTAEWSALFNERDIWHTEVNDYAALMQDPQFRHNKSITTVEGATGVPVTLVSHPVRYDGATPAVRLPPQRLGAQTAAILQEHGYGESEIKDLVTEGVVAVC